MKKDNLTYTEARESGFPFNRIIYKDDYYYVDHRNLDCSVPDLSQRRWNEKDLDANDWIIQVSQEMDELEKYLQSKKGISESDHAPVRIAVMRENINKLRQFNYVDSRLITLFEDLAMTIAKYHNKNKSIAILEKLSKKN